MDARGVLEKSIWSGRVSDYDLNLEYLYAENNNNLTYTGGEHNARIKHHISL